MLLTLLLTAAVAATPAPRFDAIQMMKLKRLGDPQLSPDGKWVAYQAADVALDAGTRTAGRRADGAAVTALDFADAWGHEEERLAAGRARNAR